MNSNLPRQLLVCLLAFIAVSPLEILAQRQLGKKKGPTSKVYIVESTGDTQIQVDGKLHTARQATAFDAPGTIIETKPGGSNTLVYSNGTGMYVDQNTRVEVNEFVQEPFQAQRAGSADAVNEPSISQSNIFVAHGAVGICTSKFFAGSSMTYGTPEAGINIRGGKVSIATNQNETIIDLLEGDITVRGAGKDGSGQILQPGERAVIRPGAAGQPAQITISPIPAEELKVVDERVNIACNAKKTVTFEIIEKRANKGLDAADGNAGAGSPTDGEAAGADDGQEIAVRPTVPVKLPTNIVVSPDRLPGG